MATKTSYLNLSKAEITDEILKTLTDNNNNFELIDSKTQEIDDKIAEIEESTGSAEGIIVLEASTDNVIDFNTLTEPGIYLIKNCNGNTTVNGVYTVTTAVMDVILEVSQVKSVDTGSITHIYQYANYGSWRIKFTRTYVASTNAWNEWDYKMLATVLNAGTLATGMKCATPTANEELANKAYVDGKSWGANKITTGQFSGMVTANTDAIASDVRQIRNIRFSSTDLTAGTSTLTTGDIVLIYE